MSTTLEENIKGLRDFIKDENTYQFYKRVIEVYADNHAKEALKNASKNATVIITGEGIMDCEVDIQSILSEDNLPKHQ